MGVLRPRTWWTSEGERGAALGWAVSGGWGGRHLLRVSLSPLGRVCCGTPSTPHFFTLRIFSLLSLSPHLLFSSCPFLFSLLFSFPLPWTFQTPILPLACSLGPLGAQGGERLPLRPLWVSALPGPGADLSSGFSQCPVQGCCGSGQLLPEPLCPPTESRIIGRTTEG